MNTLVSVLAPGQEFQERPGTPKVKVAAACPDKDGGHWYCVTHRRHLFSDFEKSGHVNSGDAHVLVWDCAGHGFEYPGPQS